MAGTQNLLTNYLALQNGSGLAEQADERGGNKFANQVIDSYAQAGEVIPDDVRSALGELNKLTNSEIDMAGASPSARAFMSGTGYNPLQVRQRAQELNSFLFDKSAHARNLTAKLQNERLAAENQTIELENQFNLRTMDDRVAQTGIARRTNELNLQTQEFTAKRAQIGQGVLDYVNKNSVGLDTMRDALLNGSANALTAAFGTTDRLAASDVYSTLMTAQNEQSAQRVQLMANQVTEQKNKLLMSGITADDALKMLAGDLPIPDGVTRMAVQQAAGEAASTADALHVLTQKQVVGFKDQKELEDSYVAALTSPMLQSIVDQISAPSTATGPQRAGAPVLVSPDGFVTLTMPDGQPTKISSQKLVDELNARRSQSLLASASQISSNAQFNAFSLQAKETTRQMNLAVQMTGMPLPTELQSRINMATQQASALFQQSFATKDVKQQAAFQEQANTIMTNAKSEVLKYLQSTGAPQYVVDDMAAGRIMSDESFRNGLRDGLGYGAGGPMTSPGLGAVVSAWQKNTKGWFTTGLSSDDIRALSTKDKDGNYPPIDTNAAPYRDLVRDVKQWSVQVMANSALDSFRSDTKLRSMLPAEYSQQIGAMLDPYNKTFNQMEPKELVGRVLDVIKLADVQAQKQQEAGISTVQGYQPGLFMRLAQQKFNDPTALTKALTGDSGVPDRGTAAVLSLFNSSQGAGDAFGQAAPMYDDIVKTTASIVGRELSTSMAGRMYDGVPAAVYSTAYRSLYGPVGPEGMGSASDMLPGIAALPSGQKANLEALAQAASAQLYAERLMTTSKPNGMFLWLRNMQGNADLWAGDDGYLIGSPDAVRNRMAQIVGVQPDQLTTWAQNEGTK